MTLRIDAAHPIPVNAPKENGFLLIVVPWENANQCSDYLTSVGVPSTLVLDDAAKSAHLELRGGWTEQHIDEMIKHVT